MNDFRRSKFIYEEILEMEVLYNNTPMEYIKENLFRVKLKKKEQYIKNCKNVNTKVGRFRLLEGLFAEHAEHSYFNKSHPSNIPFMTLIKICNYLNIKFDDLLKEPIERRSIPNTNALIKWTEELITEFISDYESSIIIEKMAEKYDISMTSVLSFYTRFKDGKDVNGKVRKIK